MWVSCVHRYIVLVIYAALTGSARSIYSVSLASRQSLRSEADATVVAGSVSAPLAGDAALSGSDPVPKAEPGYHDGASVLGPARADATVPRRTSSWLAVGLLALLALLAVLPILWSDGPRPFFIVVSYIACLVFVTILVKHALENGYRHPYAITASHMAFTAFMAAVLDPPRLEEARRVFPVSCAAVLSIAMNTCALVHGSAAFVSMMGSCTPATTYVTEILARRRHVTDTFAAVVVVCVGAACCVQGEAAFSLLSLLLALCANFARSFKSVWLHDLLGVSDEDGFSPCRIVAWTGVWGLVLMVPMVAYQEGMAPIYALKDTALSTKVALAASMLTGAGLNVIQCYVLRHLGPVLQNVVGNLQIVMVLLLATAFLGEEVAPQQWLGVVLITLGCAITKAGIRNQALQSAPDEESTIGLYGTKLPFYSKGRCGSAPEIETSSADACVDDSPADAGGPSGTCPPPTCATGEGQEYSSRTHSYDDAMY